MYVSPSSIVNSVIAPSVAEQRSCERSESENVQPVDEADGEDSEPDAAGPGRKPGMTPEEERELFRRVERVRAEAFAMLFARSEVGLFACEVAARLLKDSGEGAEERFCADVRLNAKERDAYLKGLPALIKKVQSLRARPKANAGALAKVLATFGFRLDTFELWCKNVVKEGCDEGLVGVARSVSALIHEERKLLKYVVFANQPFVKKIVRKYKRCGIDAEDLEQAGMAALMQRSYYFDFAHKVRLCTYAGRWILQAVARAAREGRLGIDVPVRSHKDTKAIREAQANLAVELGRNPSDAEIARRTGLELKVVRDLRPTIPDFSRFEAPVGDADSDGCIGDAIPDESVRDALVELEKEETAAVLHAALNRLDERERNVLVLLYGICGCEETSGAEIGRRLGISRGRVSAIAECALGKLRKILVSDDEERFGCE